MIFVRTLPNVTAHFRCSEESAQRYIDLRDEGHGSYQAALMAGLADPWEPSEQTTERRMTDIDTGDHVRHEPTGEEWVVACVQNGRLSWCGWPEGTADLADCTLIRKVSAEKRDELLRTLAEVQGNDHRARYARGVLERQAKAASGVSGETRSGASDGSEPDKQNLNSVPKR
jgi:hypothetical protein